VGGTDSAVAVVGELGQQAARGGQHLKRVDVVLGDVDLDLGQVAEIADDRGDLMGSESVLDFGACPFGSRELAGWMRSSHPSNPGRAS